MKIKQSMFSTLLQKSVDGKLIHVNSGSKEIYNKFVQSLETGQVIEVFMDAEPDDGNLAQMAKIHKCIRILVEHTGQEFEDIKLEIKKKAGLCFKKEIEGEPFMICKSFGRCSKDELSQVIQSTIILGAELGCNLN